MNVLVADKDGAFLTHIVTLIRSWGYDADGAGTGLETLEKVKEQLFDLVLLDMTLPDMTAQELINRLKELRPDLGIVTMTGMNTDGLENQIRTLGIIYYMLKPVREKVLKEIIDHIARRKEGKRGDPDSHATVP